MLAAQSALGLVAFMALAWLLRERRGRVAWRTVAAALALQVAMALLLLKLPPVRDLFAALNEVMLALDTASRAGTSFVFGYLGGAPLPFEETQPGASFVLAFRALPPFIFHHSAFIISILFGFINFWLYFFS